MEWVSLASIPAEKVEELRGCHITVRYSYGKRQNDLKEYQGFLYNIDPVSRNLILYNVEHEAPLYATGGAEGAAEPAVDRFGKRTANSKLNFKVIIAENIQGLAVTSQRHQELPIEALDTYLSSVANR